MKKYSDKVDKIVYGGDYNPEQWPEDIWMEDMRLFKEAGIDCTFVQDNQSASTS